MDQTEQVFFVSSFTENNFGNPVNYCKLGISVQLNCKYKHGLLNRKSVFWGYQYSRYVCKKGWYVIFEKKC